MLKINEIKIGSKKQKQCQLAQAGILMKHCFRCYIVGSSGSGKTNLLLNLLTRDGYYRNYFDYVYTISPTALSLDQSYKELEKKTKYKQGEDLFYLPCEEEALQCILDVQEEEKKKAKVLVILDDIVSYKRFTNSPLLLKFAVMSRHYNVSMFILSQAFHLIPKSVRLNMSCIMYFKGARVETEKLCEQYCPAGYSKKEFEKLVDDCTSEPYSFLMIDLNTPMHGKIPRYRSGLSGDLLGVTKTKKK